VQAFVGHAMQSKVPFAMETVFSHWRERPDGSIDSKIDLIRDMKVAGYFVLLIFVGLTDVDLSILRVQTRVAENGHAVAIERLLQRFPRTQHAISQASKVADASIFTDNSRDKTMAFTVCRVQLADQQLFDLRTQSKTVPSAILKWLEIVCPIKQ
jgi:predicted ABC-type ATPase